MTDLLVPVIVGGLAAGVVIFLIVLRLVGKRPKELYPQKDEKKAAEKVKRLDKERKKALGKLKEIKGAAKASEPPVIKPDAVLPSPLQPLASLDQIAIPRKIPIELTRIRGGKRAVVRKGTATLVPRLMNSQDVFLVFVGKMGYFIDPANIITVTEKGKTKEKLVFDVFTCEPLDQQGNVIWSPTVEKLLVDSAMDQYITVATFEGSFQLTSQLIRILIVVGLLGSFMGLAINGAVHLIPITVINWVP